MGEEVLAVHGPPGALGAASIRRLMEGEPPLIGGLADPERQIQPNGVDLRLESVWTTTGAGRIAVDDAERTIPDRREVAADGDAYMLGPGAYIVRLVEAVALPRDVMAFGRPRSSMLRCGVAVHTAVWDAGYRGRSEALLVVYNPAGFRVQRGARILQLVFIRLDAPTISYDGHYQGENL
ncbi:MAG: deoxyuridine 5'-triphosphate nucleotidohydrolase [Chloroflexota bacterium]|nr:deoxyuridine 5'-triphosphate nucleotidohydrolase [Chloroflexota bacterium]